MKSPTYKIQAILDGQSSWPYVGNGYLNADGSITLVLDRGVTIELPDSRKLTATDAGKVRLMVRKPYKANGNETPGPAAPSESGQ